MPSALPLPVLSVTADAVRDLDGREALSGLWTLFTKCKESLQDGRRLENISWRLWYRELQQPICVLPDGDMGLFEEEKLALSPPSSSDSLSDLAPVQPLTGTTAYSYFTREEAIPILSPPAYLYSTLQGASSLNLRKPSIADLQPTSTSTTSSSLSSSLTVTPPKGALGSENNTNINAINTNTLSRTPSRTPAQQQQLTINTLSSVASPPFPGPSIPQSGSSSSALSTTTNARSLTPSSMSSSPSPSRAGSQSTHISSQSNPQPYPHSNPQQSQKQTYNILPSISSISSFRTERSMSERNSSIEGGGYTPLELNFNLGLNESRSRRSSFAGLRVGEIICDMLPPTPPSSVPAPHGGGGLETATGVSTITNTTMAIGISDPNTNININTNTNQAPMGTPHRIDGTSLGSGLGLAMAEAEMLRAGSSSLNGRKAGGFSIGGKGVGVHGSSLSSTSSTSSSGSSSRSGSETRDGKVRVQVQQERGGVNGKLNMAPGIVMTPLVGRRREGEATGASKGTCVGLLTPETEEMPEQKEMSNGHSTTIQTFEDQQQLQLQQVQQHQKTSSLLFSVPSAAAVEALEIPLLLTPTSLSATSPTPTPDSTPEEQDLQTCKSTRPQAPHVTVASDAFAAHVAMFGDVAAGQIARTMSVGMGATAAPGLAPGSGEERERDSDMDRDAQRRREGGISMSALEPQESDSRYPVSGDVDGTRGVGDRREDMQPNQPESQHMASHSQSPSSQQAPQPPLLVVVNPTPNLTPHPTPPSTPVLYGGLGRGQWLMLPGQQRPPTAQSEEVRAIQQMPPPMLGHAYHLQQAQLAQLLPPLTFPPPVRPHTLAYGIDDASGGANAAMIHAQGNGRSPLMASSDRAETEESPVFGHEGAIGGPTLSNGLAHTHAHTGTHGLVRPHAAAYNAVTHAQLVGLQEGMGSAGSHVHYQGYPPAQEDAGIADVNLSTQNILACAQPLLPHLAHTLSDTVGSEYELILHGQVLSSHHSEGGFKGDKPKTSTTNLGGVGAARDNVNRRSISSTTSTSSHTTSASSQSTRSRVTASSSATSASGTSSVGSKNTLGGGAEAQSDDDEEQSQGTATRENKRLGAVDNQMVVDATDVMAVDTNAAIATDGWRQEENVESTRRHEDDEALEEEDDDPLSPLPTVTSFGLSHSPNGTDRDHNRTKDNKRYSAPPRSTSDSAQMRIALSLSPSHAQSVSPGRQLNDDVQQHQEESSQPGQPSALPRTRSVSSTRSVVSAGKRSSHSTANKRKGSVGPPPVPVATTSATATTPATKPARIASKAVGAGVSTMAVRRSSSTRSTSRSVGGSSLGDSRSRSRDAGMGLGHGLGMTTTTSAAPGPLATGVAPARTRTATRGRAKFVLGRAGNKKAGGLLRRNSSGMGRTKTKHKEEQADEDEDDDDDDDEEDEGEVVDQGELQREVTITQAEREKREFEARERMRVENEQRERERMFSQEQARHAAVAEEKQRRRELERQQALIDTLTSRAPPPTAETASEISSKRPIRFNIGSNSDDGMGGKSAGSGSDASSAVGGQNVRGPDGVVVEGREKGKGKEVPTEQQQQQRQQRQWQHQHQHPQRYQHAYPLQQHHQHVPVQLPATQYIQAHGGEISKQQLRQLEGIQQMHQQIHPRANVAQMQQYQQQFQPPPQQQPQQVQPPPTGPSRQATMTQAQIAAAVAHVTNGEKGKQREVTVAPVIGSAGKSKKGNNSTRTAHADPGVDASILAKVKESLNTPLLPTGKKRVELVPSESEFETTDDEADDGDWSSAEMTADDEELKLQVAQEENEKIKSLANQLRQMQELGQRQQPPVRPPGVQRTHSSHYPAPNNARGKQAVRIQQQRQAQANAQAVVNQAMIEAQRQRDMFVKLPTSSFQDLAKARARSVGLLSQLMNPDPEIFPVNHPYRRGLSSQEVRRGGISAMAAMQPMIPARTTPAPAVPTPAAPTPAAPIAKSSAVQAPAATVTASRPPIHRRTSTDVSSIRSTFSPPLRNSGLATSKSAAALPMATQIQVGSVSTMHVTAAHKFDKPTGAPSHVQIDNRGMGGGYRPRGPPKGPVEYDSDSDDGGITMSKSVAQEKLRALAQRGIQPTRRNREENAAGPSEARPPQPQPTAMDDNDVPHWAMVSQPQHQQNRNHPPRRIPAGLQITNIQSELRVTPPPTTAPIAVEYPYNLPIANPPATPRTVRRNMLSTEMSESLRRNLLWQRQSTRANTAALRRTASSGGTRNNNVLGDGVRPLTAAPSMVQLHAKGTKTEGTSQIPPRLHPPTEEERAEARRRRAANNKSYDDYHYSGW